MVLLHRLKPVGTCET